MELADVVSLIQSNQIVQSFDSKVSQLVIKAFTDLVATSIKLGISHNGSKNTLSQDLEQMEHKRDISTQMEDDRDIGGT